MTIRGAQAEDWSRALAALPIEQQDVYFTSEYHALHQANGDGEPWCFTFADAERRLLVPGLQVPIAAIAAVAADETPRWDLQTCNGYGGPLANSEDAAFLDAGWAAWRQAACARGVVAALFRIHPLLDNHRYLPADATLLRERNTVFIELAAGLTAAWNASESRHRNMVNRAKRAGSLVTWQSASDWQAFVALYADAMERLQASAALRFGPAYFQGLQQLRGSELAAVHDASGALVGAATFLWGARYGHYHLSARRSDAPNYVSNQLLQAGIERAAELGLLGLHLGGGTSNDPDDSLLRFKRSLGGRLVDFRVARVIADPVAYAQLVAQWTQATGAAPRWLLGYRQPRPG